MKFKTDEDGNTHISVSKKWVRKLAKKIRKGFYRVIYFFNKNAKCIPEKYRKKFAKEAEEKAASKSKGSKKSSSLKERYYKWKNERIMKQTGIWDYVKGKYARYNPDPA